MECLVCEYTEDDCIVQYSGFNMLQKAAFLSKTSVWLQKYLMLTSLYSPQIQLSIYTKDEKSLIFTLTIYQHVIHGTLQLFMWSDKY